MDVPLHFEAAGGWLDDPRNQLQQRALAGAVAADEGDLFTATDVERHAIERGVLGVDVGPISEQAEHVEESVRRSSIQTIDLAQVAGADYHVVHACSSTPRLLVRYLVPHSAHVAAAGGCAPLASLTPHWHIHPDTRAGLPTSSA